MQNLITTILLAAIALCLTAAQSQIPSTPFVQLNVLSNSAVGVNVSLPISDGGSAINSYVVEWDTNPGVREVQTVQTTTVNGSFEVQQLTTTALVRPEVQVVTSKAQAVPEVQQITVSGATGGYFFVALDTSASGGSLQYSGNIYVSYPASGTTDGRDAENIITAMANVDFGAVVTRAAGPNTGDYVYQVTFPPTMGDVPQMTVVSSSLTPVPTAVASTSTVVQGNVIGGSFRLGFEGQMTSSLPYDASANDVRLALERLTTLGVVVVSRTGPDYQNGYAWTVTFADPMNAGNMPAIIPQYAGLTVSSVGAAVNMSVASTDGNQIGGTFTVSWTNQASTPVTGTTAPIAFNATASQVRSPWVSPSPTSLPLGHSLTQYPSPAFLPQPPPPHPPFTVRRGAKRHVQQRPAHGLHRRDPQRPRRPGRLRLDRHLLGKLQTGVFRGAELVQFRHGGVDGHASVHEGGEDQDGGGQRAHRGVLCAVVHGRAHGVSGARLVCARRRRRPHAGAPFTSASMPLSRPLNKLYLPSPTPSCRCAFFQCIHAPI